MFKDDERFSVYDYGCGINHGREIKLNCSIYPKTDKNTEDIKYLISKNKIDKVLNQREIDIILKNRINEEQKIYEKLRYSLNEWAAAAEQTKIAKMAIEYLNAPKVKHTNNKWQTGQYNNYFEISNAVYKMTYDIYEDTKYNRKTEESEPVAWYVTWNLYTNSPLSNRNTSLAGQYRKRYTDKNKAYQYIEGRKKAYEHLFKEEYPEIPKQYANIFKVNGVLLPQYKVGDK